MKKFNRKLIHGTNWALAGILSLLGFSSCNGIIRVEYGSPNADYKVSGRVTDEQGTPVPDVKVQLGKGEQLHYASFDSTRTGQDGRYSVSANYLPIGALDLVISDTDGEANGSFENDTIHVTFESEDYYKRGKGDWYEGAAKKEVNVKLKAKKKS